MDNLEEERISIVKFAKTDMDHLSEIAKDFTGIFKDYIANQNDLQKTEIQFQEKALESNKAIFKYKFWLLAGGLISIVSIASGIIFYLNTPSLGVSLLSHTGAIIGGIVAGVGYESSRSK